MKITWESPRVREVTFKDLALGELFTIPPEIQPIYIKTRICAAVALDSRDAGEILIGSNHTVEPCEAVEIKVRRV